MKITENGIPRRTRVDLYTPAELAIRNAMLAIEDAGAHPLLTEAVTLLAAAKDKVADFVDLSRSAAPGPAWRDIAASAYRAYAASTGNRNFRGEPMPEFDALPASIRIAWEAATRQAVDVAVSAGNMGDEQRWAGWKQP